MTSNLRDEIATRRSLELAWDAFRAGSFPVGAVLLDASGAVIAEGRNRMGDGDAPPGRLRGTGLAHAEIDVLAQLPLGDHRALTLVTSLEPCLLCRSAATMTGIGHVRFVASDALCEGLGQLPSINAHTARQSPKFDGPSSGLATVFAETLPLAVLLLFGTSPETSAHYRSRRPDTFRRASSIVDNNAWPSRELSLDGAIEHVAQLVV